ncbi:MAG: RNA pseudouridine synthase [Halobacteriovoraceae bacterium]|jgi:23S rRNA pseudouridine1911/1915/1917 synthase|nr:RNA pseudouridine synthase [Halobacteriovoraceae bacterium]
MKDNGEISFCVLRNYSSLKEAVQVIFSISNQQLKKNKLSKKKLDRSIKQHDEITLSLNIINHHKINPEYTGSGISIIYEDDEIFGISKPEKTHTHPLCYLDQNNTLSYLRQAGFWRELSINKEKYDRGLLYRLDFETSGLLLYAKNNHIYQELRADFSKYVKEKKYLVICEGECRIEGLITHYLKASRSKGELILASDHEKLGFTQAQLTLNFKGYNKEHDISLIEVRLFQGHRHQIRVQLQNLGHAILGDPVYGNRSADRMFLHCWKYKVNFTSEKVIIDNNLGLFNDFFNLDREL